MGTQISPQFRRKLEAEVRRLMGQEGRASEALTPSTRSDLQAHAKRLDKALREADYAINNFNTQVQIAARSEPQDKGELTKVMRANGEIAKLTGQALGAWAGIKRAI